MLRKNESAVGIEVANKSLVLTFKGEYNSNDTFDAYFTKEEAVSLLSNIEDHLISINEIGKVKPEHKAYSEEIHTYVKEVERTMSIGFDSTRNRLWLHLICHTDAADDNWIRLTPTKAASFASIIHGYIDQLV